MKFLIVDDHPMLRDGVAAVLHQFDTDVTVLQAADGEQGLALTAEHPDLAVAWVDLRMAGMAGLDTIEQLRRRHPALPVIVLSSSEDPDDVRRALRAGARGYCPKSAGSATLLAALRLVLAGEIYVPPFMAELAPSTVEPVPASGLTARQLEVLQLLCKGHTNRDIGRLLGMQEKTVKGHVSAIFRTLKVVHRLQAVEAARAAGIAG
jgi:two-component system, NarL family, nitrate/nitrite response regulator NarL